MKNKSFHFKYGGYLVYLVFLLGFFVSGGVAYMHFVMGKWFFGAWALFSIFMLPRPVLALVLLAGHKSGVFVNMPAVLRMIFPRTMQRYRGDSFIYYEGKQIIKSVISELGWLIVWLVPIIEFFLPIYSVT